MKDLLLEALIEFQAKLLREGLELEGLVLSKESIEELKAENGIAFNNIRTPYRLIFIRSSES